MDFITEKKPRQTFFRLGLAFFLFFVVTFGMQLAALLIIRFLRIEIQPGHVMNVQLVMNGMSMYLAGFPVCYLVLRTIPVETRITKQALKGRQLIGIFMVCFCAMYLGNLLGMALMQFRQYLGQTPQANPVEAAVLNSSMSLNLILTVILAPLMEELLYRKLLIDRIKEYGEARAILLSGLMFAFSHGNFYQFFYALALGLIFAYVYVRTGDVTYCMIYHILINFMGSVVSVMVLRAGAFVILIYAVALLALIIGGIREFFIQVKKIHIEPAQVPLSHGFRTVYLNVGMGLFLVCCGFLFYTSF